jgi:malonyl-CoA/methylmalonyl-CoA synthetase
MAACETLKDRFLLSFRNNEQRQALFFFRKGDVETQMSYRDLSVDANRLASLLWRLGVNKGDRVVLYLEKSVFSVVAHIALQIVGAVGVPLNPGFKKAEMIYLLNDAAPTLIVAGSDQKKVIRDIDPRLSILLVDTAKAYQNLEILDGSRDAPPSIEIQADDPALIIYTSGTTGKTKGAVLTHRNLLDDVTKIIKFWKITESDVLCHALPLFHIHGLCFALNTTLIGGARIVMLDTFSPDTVIRILTLKANAYTCSIFMGVPSMYTRMLPTSDCGPRDLPLLLQRTLNE